MSSIGFNRSEYISADEQENFVQEQDDAQFFSVAQQYNQRKAKMINFRAMEAMNMIHNFNIKNNPKDPKASQAKQEKTRKTRNDKQGRQFICGNCKLSYLSYPALYTHIKTKHGGIAPQGTIRGKNNNNKRRGRPKNIRAQPNLYHRPEPEFIFPKQYSDIVDKYQITFVETDQLQNQERQQQVYKVQSLFFQEQVRQLKNINSPLITLPIIKVLTIYLHNVTQIVGHRQDIMRTIEAVSERLVNFINKNYSKILNEYQNSSSYFIRKELPENQVYCQYEKCDYLPVFVSQLFKRMDGDNDQLQIDYLSDFSKWLNKKKLTYIKLLKPEVLEAGNILSE